MNMIRPVNDTMSLSGVGNRGYYRAKCKYVYSLIAAHQLFGLYNT